MGWALIALAGCALTGCAYLHSTTKAVTNPTNQVMTVTTTVRCYTLFDSQAQLTKFNNRGQLVVSNEWAPGTYVGSLSQNSSTTNVNAILASMVAAAIKAMGVP